MPITKDGNGAIVYTEPHNKQRSDATGAVVDSEFAIIDETNVVKQIKFNILPSDNNPGVLTLNCTIGPDASLDLTSGGGAAAWGAITGTLSSQTDLQTALNAKQNSLGFTAENVANKDIDGTLAANSDTKYPSQKAIKTYVGGRATTTLNNLGTTAVNADISPSTDGFGAGVRLLGNATHAWNGLYVKDLYDANDTSAFNIPDRLLIDGGGTTRIDLNGLIYETNGSVVFDFTNSTPILTNGVDLNGHEALAAADPTTPQSLTTVAWVQANSINSVFEDSSPQLGGNVTTNDRVIMGNFLRSANGAPSIPITESYVHSTTLTALQVAAVAFTFPHATYGAAEYSYSIKEATTNRVRQGVLRVATDGSTASITDIGFAETADAGVVWTAGVNGSNVEVKYTTTANNKTMRADIKKFLA